MPRRRADWPSGEPALVITACSRCGNHWYLPRTHCPICGSADTSDVTARGRGLCVALTRLHVTLADADADAPVRLALVELDEGPVVMGRVHDDALAPGDRATVAFHPDGPDGGLVPSFAQEGRP